MLAFGVARSHTFWWLEQCCMYEMAQGSNTPAKYEVFGLVYI